MQSVPNLLIVASTGTGSGKTTMVCRIIEQFSDAGIVAVRVSPHFHEKTDGLLRISEDEGCCVSMETNPDTAKDTSRMLRSGASRVYLVESREELLGDVFLKLMMDIPNNTPVICESPALRDYLEPGLFILMSPDNVNKRRELSHLELLPHQMFDLDDLSLHEEIPVRFIDGRWEDLRTRINDF